MLRKTSIRVAYATLLSTIVLLILPVFHEKIHEIDMVDYEIERKSKNDVPFDLFAQVLRTTYIHPISCMEKNVSCDIEGKSFSNKSIGSSIILGSNSGVAYILTAQHVCEHRKADALLIGDTAYDYAYHEKLSVKTFTGETAEALVVSTDSNTDLCLMVASLSVDKSVSIKMTEIVMGEKVQNIAAPVGIFSPGMLLTFQGRNSGVDPLGNAYFSFPGAPGSSGSPVFDDRGKLVSVIHSAHLQFDHFSIGVSQKNLLGFLYRNDEYISFLGYFSDLPK